MFYRFLILLFKVLVYSKYYVKYSIPRNFRFNGFLIRINGDGRVKFGNNCYISFYSYINVQKGSELIVGDDVSIGHNVKIYTSSIDTKLFVTKGIKNQIVSSVHIGNNVLIGANVFICPGVTIGDNVFIGANSVVSKSIPPNSVAAGCPALVVKSYD